MRQGGLSTCQCMYNHVQPGPSMMHSVECATSDWKIGLKIWYGAYEMAMERIRGSCLMLNNFGCCSFDITLSKECYMHYAFRRVLYTSHFPRSAISNFHDPEYHPQQILGQGH
jgi:hypothetical protein